MRTFIIYIDGTHINVTADNQAQAIRCAKNMGWIQEDSIFVIEERIK